MTAGQKIKPVSGETGVLINKKTQTKVVMLACTIGALAIGIIVGCHLSNFLGLGVADWAYPLAILFPSTVSAVCLLAYNKMIKENKNGDKSSRLLEIASACSAVIALCGLAISGIIPVPIIGTAVLCTAANYGSYKYRKHQEEMDKLPQL